MTDLDRSDEAAGAEPGRRLVVTRAAQVKPKRLEWWEHGLVLRSAVNLLAAREGQGKSTVAASWAARETRAGGCVLWIGTEESREHAVVPRLIAAGADLEKVLFVDVETELGTGALQLPLDLCRVDDVICQHRVTMLVIDPAKGCVPPGFSGNDDIAVRQYLEPIAGLADRRQVTVIGLAHFGKREGSDSGRLMLGSVAWSQVARCVLSIAVDDDSGTRVLSNTKANYCETDRSVAFRISAATIQLDDGPAEIGRVEWLGDTELHARELLDDPGDRDERTAAEHWLHDYLLANGATPSKEVKAEARRAGIAESTLKRAKKKLGVIDRSEGFPRTSTWSLDMREPTEPTGVSREPTEPTEPTGRDQHKRGEPTGEIFQSAQSAHSHDTEPTVAACTACGAGLEREESLSAGLCTECRTVTSNPSTPPPPGAPTASTPGMTERVQQIIASNSRNGRRPICPDCQRAPARSDTGRCDFCTAKATATTGLMERKSS